MPISTVVAPGSRLTFDSGVLSGKIGDNDVWSAARARYDRGRIATYSSLLTPNDEYLRDVFYSTFKYNWQQPFDISNQNFVVEWMFSPEDVTVKTDQFGEIIFEYAAPLGPSEKAFKGIGTRGPNGDGPCTFYFEDIYVYRKTTPPANNLLLLEESPGKVTHTKISGAGGPENGPDMSQNRKRITQKMTIRSGFKKRS